MDESAFLATLTRTVGALHRADVPFALAGGAALYARGGPHSHHDIDLLVAAIDDAGADLAVHGHAHAGTEQGRTAGGVAVRNVARPLIRAPYAVYQVSGNPIAAASTASAANIHAT